MTTHARTLEPTTLGGAACPACGRLTRRGADLGEFRLHACDGCGSWSSDAQLHGARTSFAPTAYFEHADADRPRWQELAGMLGDGPRDSLLDVGCGGGEFLAWAGTTLGCRSLTGIEIDDERALRARARNAEATIHAGDALQVGERLTASYDLITMWDVLEHVPEPARLLQALSRRLAPGGLLYLQTIHEASLVPSIGRWSYRLSGGRFRAGIRRTHDAHHLVFFTRAGVARMAADAGLAVRRQWFGRLALERMDGPRWLTVPTAAALAAENALGNGLFLNVLLSRAEDRRGGRAGGHA